MTGLGTPLNSLQWAVSHNSYDTRQQYLAAKLPFEIDRFYTAGFRGIELDIAQDGTNPEWCVTHSNGYDPDCKLLSTYLQEIGTWSASAVHEPLFIHLDCKDYTVAPDFADQLDGYLLRHMAGCSLYRPKDLLIGSSDDLMKDAMTQGWQAPSALMSHFIFVLTGSPEPKELYPEQQPAQRVCFADRDLNFAFPTDSGTRIVANSELGNNSGSPVFGDWCAAHQAVLWREWAADTDDHFDEIAGHGVHMIAASACLQLPRKGFWPNPCAAG